MKIGIIGLPGSGKSSLWGCLTGALEGPDAARSGKLQLRTVKMRDARLERLRDDFKPKKWTPVAFEIGDFPPMAKDERDRAGMAQLLAPARGMDALIVVLRGFENPLNPPYGGRVDPIRDWEEIRSELLLSDLVIVEKRLEKLRAQVKKPTPTLEKDRNELELLQKLQYHLEEERDLLEFRLKEEEQKLIAGFQFLSLKPKVPILNRGDAPPPPEQLAELEKRVGGQAVSVRNELEILQLPEADREVFREELGVLPDTTDRILSECCRAASRISFFTVSEKEVRSWTIRKGDSAIVAAGVVHTDMARGFIRAETVSFDDYVRCGGIKGAREKGHLRLEGKDYVVQDGDIIQFRFNP